MPVTPILEEPNERKVGHEQASVSDAPRTRRIRVPVARPDRRPHLHGCAHRRHHVGEPVSVGSDRGHAIRGPGQRHERAERPGLPVVPAHDDSLRPPRGPHSDHPGPPPREPADERRARNRRLSHAHRHPVDRASAGPRRRMVVDLRPHRWPPLGACGDSARDPRVTHLGPTSGGFRRRLVERGVHGALLHRRIARDPA